MLEVQGFLSMSKNPDMYARYTERMAVAVAERSFDTSFLSIAEKRCN